MAEAQHIDDELIFPEGSPRLEGGVDPELVALPRPSRWRRGVTMVVMAVTVVACLILMRSLASDIRYFFSPTEPMNLGEVAALSPADVEEERYVVVNGTPMASQAIRYDRQLGSARYALFPLAGQRNVFVEVPEEDTAAATNARREFSGRLTTFRALGARYESLREHLENHTSLPISRDSLLLLADRPPGSALWSLLLAMLFGFFVLLNLVLIVRWFRPLKQPVANPDPA